MQYIVFYGELFFFFRSNIAEQKCIFSNMAHG